jgi:hypothetical protein
MKHEVEVLNTVANHYNLTVKDILSERRSRELVAARRSAYLAYRHLNWTVTRIAETFGRDHSTIVVAIQNANDDDRVLADKLVAMATTPDLFELRREVVDDGYEYVIRNPRTEEEIELPRCVENYVTEALTYCDDDA